MTASTWTWFGGTAFSTIAADWTLTPGGGNGIPQPGDTVLIAAGTVQDGLGVLAGQGSVTIQAGGTVSVTSSTDGISLGQTAATAGTLTVTDATSLLTLASGTNGIVVGGAGTGSLFVQNHGSVTAGPRTGGAVNIGVASTGTGSVAVSGLGSSLKATGQIDVGVAGGGSLSVSNQGTVISGASTLAPTQGIDVGQSAGASGTITVTGTNSLLNNTGAFIVGDAGSGSVTIGSGGTVITGPGTVAGLAGMVIGNTSSSSGSGVTLTGPGSQLQVTGLLQVGAAGSGSLQLSGGATVSANSLDEGVASTGVGNIGLTGPGTSLTLTGAAIVADASTNGVLSILGGATFSAASLTIGAGNGSAGFVNLLDPGSVINLTGELNIGTVLGAATGTGVLTIGSGAAVHAPVVDLQSGQVVLEGGLLDPSVMTLLGTTTSGFGTIGAAFVIDEGTILSNGSGLNKTNLEVLGTVLGGGTLTITGSSPLVGTTKHAPGLLQIGVGDTLEINGAVLNAAATTFSDTQGGTYLVNNSVVDVVFQDNTGVLTLDDIAGFGGTIATYHPGDALVITGGTLSNLGVKNGNTLTVTDTGLGAGAGGIDQIIFSAGIDPTTLTIKNGNTIVASTSAIANGTTLEIAAGPFGLTNFNAVSTPQYTTLLVDPGVSLIADASDLLSGVTVTDLGQISLTGGTMTGGAVTVAGTTGFTASGTVTGGGDWAGMSQLVVGGAGAGSFLVNNAGTAAAASLDLAASAGGSGALTVTGTKSLFSDAGALTIGDAGLGSLSIQSSGTVTTAAGATIANTTSASGSSVNVSGAGSNWQVGGALVVGASGFGQLAISQSGSVGAASVDLGSAASGSAGLLVSGANSVLNVAGLVTIGDQSGATVSLLQDGSLFANDLNVGTGNGIGELVVDGTPVGGFVFDQSGAVLNPALSVANDMTVGANGVFRLGANEVVHIANNFVIAGPVIQGAGSQIDPATITNITKTGGGGGASQTGSTKIVNNSTYYAGEDKNGSFILNTPSLSGTGVLEVGQLTLNTAGAPGDLVLNAGVVDVTQTVNFVGGPGTLTLGKNGAVTAITGFHATINSFNADDTIVVDTAAAATFALNGSVVTISTGGTLTFASAVAAQTAFNTAGGLVDQVVSCFAAGTRIETVDGPVAVETLRVGDEVRTLLGGPGRIVWAGSRAVDCAAHPRPQNVWPIRIRRDAFGAGLPERDLFVSPDHAIYLDGVLIPAKLLVNGTTVRQVKRRLVTYHHIELERHDVVLAEGLPAETYLDTGDRLDFASETTVRLFPDFAARLARDTARVWEAKGAAPLVMAGKELAAARRLATGSQRGRNEDDERRKRSAA